MKNKKTQELTIEYIPEGEDGLGAVDAGLLKALLIWLRAHETEVQAMQARLDRHPKTR